MNTKNVRIIGNNIFDNQVGLMIRNSEVDIRENNIFDNRLWGIWSQNNSWCNISMNKVFRNKAGGVRVGYRAAGPEFLPSVVDLNDIYDNIGPGFVDDALGNELETSKKSFLNSPNSPQSAECQNNKIHDNKETKDVCALDFSVPYCSNCRKNSELSKCGKCFTAAYCNKTCSENHWSKHKKICKVLRNKTSLLITSMERVGYDGMIKRHGKGLEEIGPNFSSPPPRDGRRFVVKVQSALENVRELETYTLLLYDRSLELYEKVESKIIAELVQEFGIQCQRQRVEKKLFLYCLFEKNGQLRIFTNEFSDFLKW
jgi:parallel beta-helix repeat protein